MATFRFAPDILRRLGEELNPSLEHGVIELVKNSRDADARTCKVKLSRVTAPGGTIHVTDDGDGMTADELVEGFLLLGRSPKVGRGRTRRGRVLAGSKGLGRLAALRAGSGAEIRTRPRTEPDLEHRIDLTWSEFDDVAAVEDVDIEIETSRRAPGEPNGTDIHIRGLTARLGRREIKRLARSLLLLADPFDDDPSDFRTRLTAREFEDLEALVRKKYFDSAEYRLEARVDHGGRATAAVMDWRGATLYQAEHSELRLRTGKEPYRCPPARFELWAFILNAQTFQTRNASLGEVKDWLAEFGGVMLYVNGIRVPPYGDPGNDWLSLDLRRVRSPEERPSTNTAIGRIRVDEDAGAFTEKTDRSGVIENAAFADLRQMAVDALEWMARERLRTREGQRQQRRAGAAPAGRELRTKLEKELTRLAEENPSATDAKSLFDEYASTQERAHRAMREEVQLYRTLGTAGIAAATFAHEYAGGPLKVIRRSVAALRRRLQAVLNPVPENIAEPIGLVESSTTTLGTFTDGTLSLVDRDKRRVGRTELHKVITQVADTYHPFITDREAELYVEFCDANPYLRSSAAAIESIVVNLLTNALNAVSTSTEPVRHIRLTTDVSDDLLVLAVSDNGPGVQHFSTDEIWLPGVTSRPGGSGLGLTIVKDTVIDLGGTVRAVASGRLGGADFEIELPILGR
jgi:signal transduction histidine kinase